MTKAQNKFFNETIKPQISNLIKKSRENCISVSYSFPNEKKCGFTLFFVKNIFTNEEMVQLTTFKMTDSFRTWFRENYELFIEMFKENGITPYFFFDESVIKDIARKEIISTMESKDLDSIIYVTN